MPEENMKYNYCILSYNRVNLLKRLIESINRYCPGDGQILVFDNGSNDGTAEYLKSLGDKIKFHLSPQNLGVPKGWNWLMQNSSEGLCFIMNDDYEVVNSGWEAQYEELFSKNPNASVGSFPAGGNPGFKEYDNYVLENKGRFTHNFRLFCIPKSVYDKVGSFDERYFYCYEDTDFNMRTIKNGFKLFEVYFPLPMVMHVDAKDNERLATHSRVLGPSHNIFYATWPNGI